MKIYIIRHGETKHNKDRIFQGWRDIQLSEKGINDTVKKAKNFPKDFDVCFSSTLVRAVKTAEILVPYLDIIKDERLKERKLGVLENTVVTPQKISALDEIKAPKGAETMEEIDLRVKSFIEMLKRDYDGKKVLIVTHAGTVLSLMRVLKLDNMRIGNLEMKEIEI